MTRTGDDSNDGPDLLMRLFLKFGAALGLSAVLFCTGLFSVGERMMERSHRYREPLDLVVQVPFVAALSLLGGIVMFIAYSPWSDDEESDE